MRSISSRQNPNVQACRELAQRPDPSGVRVLLDGVHLVKDARAAGLTFELVAVARSRLDGTTEEAALAQQCQQDGLPVYAVADTAFSAMSPVRQPSGIVAIGRRSPTQIEDIYDHPKKFALVAVGVQDPGNLGALIRAAEAGGVTGVLVCGASANPYSWRALRGGMGSALRLPVVSVPDTSACLDTLRTAEVKRVAAVPRGGLDPDAVDWTGPVALVIGGEGHGIDDDASAACDEMVTIPMTPPVESLNLAVAAAVLIYTARRYRL